jgi:hypothetical protein
MNGGCMKNNQLRKVVIYSYIFQCSLYIFVLFMGGRLLSFSINDFIRFSETNYLLPSIIIIITSLYMIYYNGANLYINRISINDNNIIIDNPDTKLVIEIDDIDEFVEYKPNIFGTKAEELQLKTRKRIYNRGINSIILFWYKTNKIPISQYNQTVVENIKNKVRKY